MSEEVVTLAPGQAKTIDAAGRFVFILGADASVYVGAIFPQSAEHSLAGAEQGIILGPRDQARWEHDFTSLRLINQSGVAQDVTIKASYAQYFPKQEGGEVVLVGQTVPIEVVTDPGSPIDVTVNGGINIAGQVGISIDDQTIIPQVESIAPNGMVTGGAVQPTAGGATIAANADRIAITLRCDSTNNAGPIFVNGVPLYATDPAMTIHTNAAIDLVAGDADDTIYYFETELT
jgi:hypothetical protein